MTDLKVKSESLPTRCEICHRADLFNPETQTCSRCSSLPQHSRTNHARICKDLAITMLRFPPAALAISINLAFATGIFIIESLAILISLPFALLFMKQGGLESAWIKNYPASLRKFADKIGNIWKWVFGATKREENERPLSLSSVILPLLGCAIASLHAQAVVFDSTFLFIALLIIGGALCAAVERARYSYRLAGLPLLLSITLAMTLNFAAVNLMAKTANNKHFHDFVLPVEASVNGKYDGLQRVLYMPKDADTYTKFKDFGYWSGTTYGGYNDLPTGYWVYVYPFWYVWEREVKPRVQTPVQPVNDNQPALVAGYLPWAAQQAIGAPNTELAGDYNTAWATNYPDTGEEWLKLDYAEAVNIAAVRIRETYNPGAVVRVTAIVKNDREITLWQGQDKTSVAPEYLTIKSSANVTAQTIKIYLDTKLVAGWNEIDAVELIGADGSRQWAVQASASSSYAERYSK